MISMMILRILGAPLSERPKLPLEVDDYFEGRQASVLMAAGVSWQARTTIENNEKTGLVGNAPSTIHYG